MYARLQGSTFAFHGYKTGIDNDHGHFNVKITNQLKQSKQPRIIGDTLRRCVRKKNL